MTSSPINQKGISVRMCHKTMVTMLKTDNIHKKVAPVSNPDTLFSPLEGSHIFPLIP